MAMLHLASAPSVLPHGSAAVPLSLSVERDGLDATIDAAIRWKPQVCFSHNMRDLEVERRLLALCPVAKFMHGYFGTCIGGQKMFARPVARPCSRTFGLPCVALYLPLGCGQVSVLGLARQYRWAREQRALFDRYRFIVVASEHMKREYVRNGADPRKVRVNALFASLETQGNRASELAAPTVAFVGRMTRLKGGDLLVRAIADASTRLATPIDLIMIGDGPQRGAWETLAQQLGVRSTFVGWKEGDERAACLRRASLLAVPSVWPEPFGLVGLEAGALGVPAIAFDVGGIREWLRPGENGYLVSGDRPRASALADGLVAAFRNADELRAMGCKAASVARQMSLDRHVDRLEEILAG